MKKIFFSALCMALLATAALAQEQSKVSIDQKIKSGTKQSEDEEKAFEMAKFSQEETLQFKAVSAEIDKKTKAIKSDSSLSVEEKKQSLNAASREKRQRLVGIIGEAKYKAWFMARKKLSDARKSAQ